MTAAAHALTYLQSPAGAPWSWDEEGDAILWRDGTTVTLRQELHALLEPHLAREWPPLETLVLLLAACRGRVLAADELLHRRSGTQAGDLTALLLISPSDRVQEATSALRLVADLPPALRAASAARRVLVETLLEREPAAFPGPRDRQREVLSALADRTFPSVALNNGASVLPERALASLAQGFRGLTAEGLARRIRTGLEADLAAAPIPALRPATLVRQLLADLSRRPESAGLARIVRDVLAALRLPRRLAQSEPLATGGVADLANRGPLDRLLLSELAHDDDTLAARVALNEALYLRPEPPATPPAGAFALLLDSGVRAWGLPRVFSTAIALGLGALDEHRTSLRAWRATGPSGGRLVPVDLTTAAGLTDQLAALETSAHPGAALAAFFADPIFESAGRAPRPEAVIVLPADAAADPNFQQALASAPRLPETLYLATVDRAGNFALTLHPGEGRAPVCAAQIDLAELLAAPAPLVDPRVPADLPAYLRVQPAPFLLPPRGSVGHGITLRDGRICGVTDGHELVVWRPNARRGAQTIASGLPGGRILLLREREDGAVTLITSGRREGILPILTFPLDGGEPRRAGVELRTPPESVVMLNHDPMALFHFPARVDVVDLDTGEVKVTRMLRPEPETNIRVDLKTGAVIPLPLPGAPPRPVLTRIGPRHFRAHGELLVAGWSGTDLSWHKMTEAVPSAVAYERAGIEGHWGLTEGGTIQKLGSTESERIHNWREIPFLRFGDISSDGRLLWLRGQAAERDLIVTLLQPVRVLELAMVTRSPNGQPNLHARRDVPQRAIRRRFASIGITRDYRIVLRSPRTSHAVLSVRQDAFVVDSVSNVELATRGEMRAFEAIPLPKDLPHGLLKATWPDGSAAFLDERGLLHLRSSDPKLPEFSLVLTDGQTALWTHRGEVHGPAFFLDERVRHSFGDLARLLESFIGRLLL